MVTLHKSMISCVGSMSIILNIECIGGLISVSFGLILGIKLDPMDLKSGRTENPILSIRFVISQIYEISAL